MGSLQEQLERYAKTEYYPFHMPGHKRNVSLLKMENPYGLDITEIDDFDNLHLADGILKKIMDKGAAIYGSDHCYLLVNGSTAGILIGMAACTRHKDTVIMARNCHRSVYHGVLVNELRPVFIYPQEDREWGINKGITAAEVDNLLKKHPDAKMVIITSPTYEGILSEIEEIANLTHQYGIPLMVDEAHGAHFGLDSYFPENSIRKGADMVIHSVHKTLPAFTQTALLHVKSKLVSQERVERFFSVYQTSSPSYILMAGIENSLCLVEERPDLIKDWTESLTQFYKKSEEWNCIRVLQGEKGKKDASKLILSVQGTNITGAQLYNKLREVYHLQMEAEYVHYVIAMTSMADTKEGFERLSRALKEIDSGLFKREKKIEQPVCIPLKQKMTPYEAEGRPGKLIPFTESAGYIAKGFLFLYPPGIPIVVPGEVITKELVNAVRWYEVNELSVKGFSQDKIEKHILVIDEKETTAYNAPSGRLKNG
ncbi:MAG: aminotransferase class I/II-fold pyridoxal phosphate-dependent enzyme [Acetivibrio sp.]